MQKVGHGVILVSSGAVFAGASQLYLDHEPSGNKQALASIGQPLLMQIFNEVFDQKISSQIKF